MKTLRLRLTFALMLTALPLAALAQQSAPPATTAAPRVQSPAELRDSAAAPGELRPEDPVLPQIKLPLGKAPPVSALSAASTAQQRRLQARGGIEDTAARCAAEASSSARAACRERLARGKRTPP